MGLFAYPENLVRVARLANQPEGGVTMLLTAFAPWFAEFFLEAYGVAKSRKCPLLFALFGWLAISDVAVLLIQHYYGWNVYIWAYWIQKGGKYLILCFIAAKLCGMILGVRQKSVYALSGILVSGTIIMCAVFMQQEPLIGNRLLDGGIAATILMIGGLSLAKLECQRQLPEPWSLVFVGMVALLGSDVVVLGLSKLWWPAHHLKWLGEISALLMSNYAVWSAQKLESRLAAAKKDEVRLPMSATVRGIAER